MAEFAETPFEVHRVEMPCGGSADLRWTPFQHDGYERRGDPSVAAWSFRCDHCGVTHHVAFELRYKRRVQFGRGSTYAYLRGAPVFTNLP